MSTFRDSMLVPLADQWDVHETTACPEAYEIVRDACQATSRFYDVPLSAVHMRVTEPFGIQAFL